MHQLNVITFTPGRYIISRKRTARFSKYYFGSILQCNLLRNFFVLPRTRSKFIEHHLTSLLCADLKRMVLFYSAIICLIVARTRQLFSRTDDVSYLLGVAYLEPALWFCYFSIIRLVCTGTWCLLHFLLLFSRQYNCCRNMVFLNYEWNTALDDPYAPGPGTEFVLYLNLCYVDFLSKWYNTHCLPFCSCMWEWASSCLDQERIN